MFPPARPSEPEETWVHPHTNDEASGRTFMGRSQRSFVLSSAFCDLQFLPWVDDGSLDPVPLAEIADGAAVSPGDASERIAAPHGVRRPRTARRRRRHARYRPRDPL